MSELLTRPDYVVTDEIGRMLEVYCKICGTLIGKDRRGEFIRFRNYCEAKLRFIDGDNHVTNLCLTCLQGDKLSDLATVTAMYDADIAIMMKEVPQLADHLGPKLGPRVVAVDTKRRGIP